MVTKEDALAKANSPDDLAKRIAAAERGVFDEPGPGERGGVKRRLSADQLSGRQQERANPTQRRTDSDD